MDFCLTQPQIDGRFLNGNEITLRPLSSISQKRINFSAFEIIKCIGTGGFAKVFLCRFKEDQKFYAMKVV